MTYYQVIQPFTYQLNANSMNEAIKNFVKIHHSLNLQNIIISDQQNNYQANFKYFTQDGRNRVGINTYPYSQAITYGPSYSTYIDQPLPGVTGIPISPRIPGGVSDPLHNWDTLGPLSPYSVFSPYSTYSPYSQMSPVSPIGSPFIPTVITYR